VAYSFDRSFLHFFVTSVPLVVGARDSLRFRTTSRESRTKNGGGALLLAVLSHPRLISLSG
jgi:hypothetical protein